MSTINMAAPTAAQTAVNAASSITFTDRINRFNALNKQYIAAGTLRFRSWFKAGHFSKVDAPMIVAGVVATKPGYHLAIGFGELAAATVQQYAVGTVHAFNRLFGTSMWLVVTTVGLINKDAGKKLQDKAFAASSQIANAADTVNDGVDTATSKTVEVMQQESTVRVVTTGAGVLSVAVMVNVFTKGWLVKTISRVPSVGSPVASALKGGKGTWIALGVIAVVGALYTIGRNEAAKKQTPPAVQADEIGQVVDMPTDKFWKRA